MIFPAVSGHPRVSRPADPAAQEHRRKEHRGDQESRAAGVKENGLNGGRCERSRKDRTSADDGRDHGDDSIAAPFPSGRCSRLYQSLEIRDFPFP